jgi:hypothetical protein
MRIILKGGPLDGQSRTVPDICDQYSEPRVRDVVYKESDVTDPTSGLRVFVYKQPDARGPKRGRS